MAPNSVGKSEFSVFGFRFSVFSFQFSVFRFRLFTRAIMYHSFEDLEVWKRGCQVAVYVFEVFRESREFALRNQMQRAAVSIPSNIAEGSERGGRDFEGFLRIARGSAAELRTQLDIARRIGMLGDEPFFSSDLRAKGDFEDAHQSRPFTGQPSAGLKTEN